MTSFSDVMHLVLQRLGTHTLYEHTVGARLFMRPEQGWFRRKEVCEIRNYRACVNRCRCLCQQVSSPRVLRSAVTYRRQGRTVPLFTSRLSKDMWT